MGNKLIIYHGSTKVIEKPILGYGNPKNDYGLGFYCTQSIELAKEWACTEEENGYANKYNFDIDGLTVLDLSDGNYNILNWLAILLENRYFRTNSDIAARAKEYILSNFLPSYKNYDVIKGYRADDSYFSFASAFINSSISLSQLEKAMMLGNLGEQIVMKSELAFSRLAFLESDFAQKSIYYPKKLARDTSARKAYKSERSKAPAEDSVYVLDIIRERWQNDDSRLQRILLG